MGICEILDWSGEGFQLEVCIRRKINQLSFHVMSAPVNRSLVRMRMGLTR